MLKLTKTQTFHFVKGIVNRLWCQIDIIGVPKPGQWESSEQKKLQADCF